MQPLRTMLKRPVNPVGVAEIAVGTTVAIVLAGLIGLRYSVVAGITALLTIQNTRGATVKAAVNRLLAFALMVVLCAATLLPLRFHTLSFGLFLLLFVGISYAAGLSSVIASSAVLATHFLMEKSMAPALILNEFGLLMVGSGVGVLVKLMMPQKRVPLADYRFQIEESFRKILHAMAERTAHPPENSYSDEMEADFSRLDENLKAFEGAALMESDNHPESDGLYSAAYFQMRTRQAAFLRRMWQNLNRTVQSHGTNFLLGDFLKSVADGFSEENTAEPMLLTLDRIDHVYDKLPLPKDRKEFEDRALLYAAMQDLRSLLEIKRSFALQSGALQAPLRQQKRGRG